MVFLILVFEKVDFVKKKSADHARIQEFSSGGVQVNPTKKSSDVFFFFFSPQLILQKSNGKFQRNLSFFTVPEGVQHFPGGGGGSNFFQGGGGVGVQLLISYRNPYNL